MISVVSIDIFDPFPAQEGSVSVSRGGSITDAQHVASCSRFAQPWLHADAARAAPHYQD